MGATNLLSKPSSRKRYSPRILRQSSLKVAFRLVRGRQAFLVPQARIEAALLVATTLTIMFARRRKDAGDCVTAPPRSGTYAGVVAVIVAADIR